jgi:hypothetical protein
MPRKKTQSKKSSPKKAVKKDVNDLNIADGKDDIEKIKNLEDLLGVKQTNPYGTTSEAVLEERMNEMTLTDLQTFAIRVGILPSGNKLTLKNKLKKSFKSHAGAGAGYNVGYQKPLVDPSSKQAEEILKISREGF